MSQSQPHHLIPRALLSGRVAVTARDHVMLEALATARFLTATALEWIAFPDRRPMWEADMQARREQRDLPPYKPGRVVYRRLSTLESAGLIHRIPRPIARAGHGGGRDPDLFMLTPLGAAVLVETTTLDPDRIAAFRIRPRSSFTTNHSAEIGQIYAALRAKIAMMEGIALSDWRGDHLTARAYDQVTVMRQQRGSMVRMQLPVVPDGSFVLIHPKGKLQVFIEVDRATRRIETWRDKIAAYAAYGGSAALQARYQTDSFVLLTVTPTATQRDKVMRATAQVLGQGNARYLFTLHEAVHPLRIGNAWQRIGQIERSMQPTGLNGQLVERVTVEAIPHVFLQ